MSVDSDALSTRSPNGGFWLSSGELEIGGGGGGYDGGEEGERGLAPSNGGLIW